MVLNDMCYFFETRCIVHVNHTTGVELRRQMYVSVCLRMSAGCTERPTNNMAMTYNKPADDVISASPTSR